MRAGMVGMCLLAVPHLLTGADGHAVNVTVLQADNAKSMSAHAICGAMGSYKKMHVAAPVQLKLKAADATTTTATYTVDSTPPVVTTTTVKPTTMVRVATTTTCPQWQALCCTRLSNAGLYMLLAHAVRARLALACAHAHNTHAGGTKGQGLEVLQKRKGRLLTHGQRGWRFLVWVQQEPSGESTGQRHVFRPVC